MSGRDRRLSWSLGCTHTRDLLPKNLLPEHHLLVHPYSLKTGQRNQGRRLPTTGVSAYASSKPLRFHSHLQHWCALLSDDTSIYPATALQHAAHRIFRPYSARFEVTGAAIVVTPALTFSHPGTPSHSQWHCHLLATMRALANPVAFQRHGKHHAIHL